MVLLKLDTPRAYKGLGLKTTALQSSDSYNPLDTLRSYPLHTAMFAAAILCQLLLATVALAVPSGGARLAERVARRDAGFTHQTQPNQLVDSASVAQVDETNTVANATKAAKVSYSGNWAGAVLSAKKVYRRICLHHIRLANLPLFVPRY